MNEATVDRALREVRRALEADGPLSRSELGERLEAKGVALDQSTPPALSSASP